MSDSSTTKPTFDSTILRRAGLTDSQARGYLALIEHGELTPTELATKTGESRTNAYMLCDKLANLGLATKNDGAKIKYSANHPSSIESLVERRRKVIQKNERIVKESLGDLINYFYEKRDTPGVVTEIGRSGIEHVYNSILEDGHPVEILRSAHDSGYMSHEFYRDYSLRRAKVGVETTMIALETAAAKNRQTPTYDTEHGITERYWLDPDKYTARVEWSVYGDKVSALTFGEEPIALTIHSRDIAESLRQIFTLVKKDTRLSEFSKSQS